MLTSFKQNVLEIKHVTIGCFHLLSNKTGWIIRSRVYADVEKHVNTETEVTVVKGRGNQFQHFWFAINVIYRNLVSVFAEPVPHPKLLGRLSKSDNFDGELKNPEEPECHV